MKPLTVAQHRALVTAYEHDKIVFAGWTNWTPGSAAARETTINALSDRGLLEPVPSESYTYQLTAAGRWYIIGWQRGGGENP